MAEKLSNYHYTLIIAMFKATVLDKALSFKVFRITRSFNSTSKFVQTTLL